MSVTKGEMGLFVLCLLFHKGHCCTRPNRCKCLSISLVQCNLHFKVRLIHLVTKNKGCTIPSQLQLTGKIYKGVTALTIQVGAAWCMTFLDMKHVTEEVSDSQKHSLTFSRLQTVHKKELFCHSQTSSAHANLWLLNARKVIAVAV